VETELVASYWGAAILVIGCWTVECGLGYGELKIGGWVLGSK